MTTTTKSANGKQSPKAEPLGDGWDDAPKASTMSDHPAWMPQLCTFKDDVIAEKLDGQPAGSHADKVLIGTLTVERAFGEPRYHVTDKDGKVMGLPLHGVLTSALDCVRLTPAPRVRLAYIGEAARARQGERSAFLYDVRVQPKEALLSEPRGDALLPVHKENKEKREAANKEKGKKGKKNDAAADDSAE